MSKYSNLCLVIKTISNIAKMSGEININTVEHLGEIAPDVKTNLDLIKAWLQGDTIYVEEEASFEQPTTETPIDLSGSHLRFDPDAEWRQVNDPPLYCSSSGLIYSIEKDTILTPIYHNGDYMVTIDETNVETGKKRAGVLMARAFRIQSDDRESTTQVLEYRDGDRKNIRPDNIYWREYEPYNLQTRAIEDVCRRLVEYNGDIDMAYENYDPNDRFVTKQFIRAIFEKQNFKEISDRFFLKGSKGDIILRETSKNTQKPMGYDCGQFLRKFKEVPSTKDLLIDKVKNDYNQLSVDEIGIMVIFAIVEGKLTKTKDIAKYIRDVFKYNMPYDTIEHWKQNKDSELYVIIEGGLKI